MRRNNVEDRPRNPAAATEPAIAPADQPASAETEDKPKKRKRRTKAEIEADKAAESGQSDQPAADVAKAPTTAKPNKVTADALRAALMALYEAKGKPACEAILTKYDGAKKVVDIPEDKWVDLALDLGIA